MSARRSGGSLWGVTARALLRLTVRGPGREHVLGDLEEDHRRMAEAVGAARADRWLLRHAGATAWTWNLERGRRSVGRFARDVRYAWRALRRAPGYTTASMLTLGIGLGGVVAVATLAYSVLRPLPFPEADRLVAVWETRNGSRRGVAPANYLDWRRSAASFSGLAAHDARSASVTVDGIATRERVAVVSGNLFSVLGVEPALGQTFDPRFDVAHERRVAVLAHDAWVRLFGGDPAAVGRTMRVDEVTYEVVGVAPRDLAFPEAGLVAWLRSPFEAPEIRGFQGDLTALRDAWYFEVVGRLADGSGMAAARSEMSAIADRLAEAHPGTNDGAGTQLVPLLDQTVAGFRPTLWALALAVTLVLLAAGVNVLHLAMARATARAPDLALRSALGAGRSVLARYVLTEGCLLGALGSVLGIVLARVAVQAGVTAMGRTIPRNGEIALGAEGVALAAVLGCALGAAVSGVAFRRHLDPTLSSWSGRRSTARAGAGHALIAAQVAATIALLAASGLLARSLSEMSRVDLGFDTDGLVTLRVAMPDARERPYAERVATYEELARAAAAVPGVTAVGLGSDSPLSMGMRASVFAADAAERSQDAPDSGWQPVDAGYFGAVGIELLRGRGFEPTDREGAPDAAVVNEAFVREVFGSEHPLGRRVTIGLDGHDRPLTIVGVVADTRTRGPAAQPGPVIYRPLAQTRRFGATALFLAARGRGGAGPALAEVRTALRTAAPGLPLYAESTGDDLARPFRGAQSALLAVIGVFAATSLLLGVVGVYGVTAYTVRRRRREIGVRLALGADRGTVVREVLSGGLLRAAAGVPVGLLLAALLGRALGGVLFGVAPLDPVTLVAVCCLVLGVTCLALLGPARGAAAIPPAEATRAP